MKQKYQEALLDMACRFGETSESARLKVGALIVKNDSIIALGVNGTPSGWPTNVCEAIDGTTAWYTRHAEKNALDKLRKSHETSVDAYIFCSHACCLPCAIEMKEAGINKFFYRHSYRDDSGVQYLQDNGISVVKIT